MYMIVGLRRINCDSAIDRDGNSVDFSQITVSGMVDTNAPVTTFSGGGYGNHTIKVNSAVMTHSETVTSTNFLAVLVAMHLTVDGIVFDSYVASPIIVNGVQYSGYLTSTSGQGGSDFIIGVKDTTFTIYGSLSIRTDELRKIKSGSE